MGDKNLRPGLQRALDKIKAHGDFAARAESADIGYWMGMAKREFITIIETEIAELNHGDRQPTDGEFLTDNQYAECSIAAVRLALKVHFDENESKPLPDTALRSVLLNADRLAWELGQPRLVNGDTIRQPEGQRLWIIQGRKRGSTDVWYAISDVYTSKDGADGYVERSNAAERHWEYRATEFIDVVDLLLKIKSICEEVSRQDHKYPDGAFMCWKEIAAAIGPKKAGA